MTEIRAQQEANKNLTQEEKQALRRAKKAEKAAKAQKKGEGLGAVTAGNVQNGAKESAKGVANAAKGVSNAAKGVSNAAKGISNAAKGVRSAAKNATNTTNTTNTTKSRESQQLLYRFFSNSFFSPTTSRDLSAPPFNPTAPAGQEGIHPLFLQLGLLMGNREVCGANRRAEYLLRAMKQLLRDVPALPEESALDVPPPVGCHVVHEPHQPVRGGELRVHPQRARAVGADGAAVRGDQDEHLLRERRTRERRGDGAGGARPRGEPTERLGQVFGVQEAQHRRVSHAPDRGRRRRRHLRRVGARHRGAGRRRAPLSRHPLPRGGDRRAAEDQQRRHAAQAGAEPGRLHTRAAECATVRDGDRHQGHRLRLRHARQRLRRRRHRHRGQEKGN